MQWKVNNLFCQFDGKKIVQGVTGTDKGDVNLWGNENPPLVSEKLKLEKSLSTCSLLSNNIYRGVWGGRKVGTITTQGESACSRQQAEMPTGC